MWYPWLYFEHTFTYLHMCAYAKVCENRWEEYTIFQENQALLFWTILTCDVWSRYYLELNNKETQLKLFLMWINFGSFQSIFFIEHVIQIRKSISHCDACNNKTDFPTETAGWNLLKTYKVMLVYWEIYIFIHPKAQSSR